jgi:hypothetical protein
MVSQTRRAGTMENFREIPFVRISANWTQSLVVAGKFGVKLLPGWLAMARADAAKLLFLTGEKLKPGELGHPPWTKISGWLLGMNTRPLLFALLVVQLVSTAPQTLALSIVGRHMKGIVQLVDADAKEAELWRPGKQALRFTWDRQTKFITCRQIADAAILRPGVLVDIICYHPFFGDTYVRKVTLLSRPVRRPEKIHSTDPPVATF